MPKWKRFAIAASLLATLIGGSLWGYDTFSATPSTPSNIESAAASPPAGSAALVDSASTSSKSSQISPDATARSAAPSTANDSLRQKAARWSAKLGFSLFAGLCLGILLRIYLKAIAVIAAAATATVVAIGYFAPSSFDAEKLKHQTAQVESFAAKSGQQLYDRTMSALPSAGTAFFGLILGLKKK